MQEKEYNFFGYNQSILTNRFEKGRISMRSIIFGLIAIIFYGFANALLKQELSKFHSLTIIMTYCIVGFFLSLIFRQVLQANSQEVNLSFPNDKIGLGYLVLLGVVLFLGNYFYTSAFTSGGNLMVISSLLILTPVFAVIFRTLWVREIPNLYQILGFVFAAIAVLLVAKGNVVDS